MSKKDDQKNTSGEVGSLEEVLGEVEEPETDSTPEVESEPPVEPEMRPGMTKEDYYKELFQGGR
ncbi:hypothetical protein LCGC14_0535380 [marine sediment metagenome]|uniref:Uncharacterized protein n=1 Tax=marine sediment metagenome TaxID=412755 RepID=A0A0F9RYW0_9ZZZZ